MRPSLPFSRRGTTRFVLGQSASDGAGQFRSEVEGQIFLLLIEDAELCALIGVDDRQDFGDGFAEVMTVFSWSQHFPFSLSICYFIG